MTSLGLMAASQRKDVSIGCAVWTDKSGVTHWATGGGGREYHPIRLLWTACGAKDVPANKAWLKRMVDDVNCKRCLETENRAMESEDEA